MNQSKENFTRSAKSAVWRKRQSLGFSKTLRLTKDGKLKFMGWNEDQFITVVYWVMKTYFHGLTTDSQLSGIIHRLLLMYRARGPVSTASYYKACRLSVTRYISGRALDSSAIPGVGLDKDSLPLVLPPEWRERIVAGCPKYTRLALTMLSLSRAISGDPLSFDLDPIQLESKAEPGLIEEFAEFARKYLSTRRKTFTKYRPSDLLDEELVYHWSTKKGPNGPAIVSAYWDFIQLQDGLKDHMQVLDSRLKAPMAGLQIIRDKPSMHKMLLDCFGRYKTSLLRKLSVKADKEAKSRIFGIVDYWSQQALYPLHKHLFKILKRLPQDFTFNQHDGLQTLAAMGGPYDSVDLSSATDRFPIDLQLKVLEILSSQEIASSWKALLTSVPFHHPLVKHPIYYRAGQPMGAYSSWGLFTLTHHILLAYAASRVGKDNFDRYALLGDDIVIADLEVSAEYRALMKRLDVAISESKSHTSLDTFEFAKRWYKGEEISPFPIAGLASVLHRWHLTYQFLKEMGNKGYPLPPIRGPESFESLYGALYHGKERFIKYLVQRTALIDAIPRKGDSPEDLCVKMKEVFSLYNVPDEWSIGPEKVEKLYSLAGSRALGYAIARDSSRLQIAAGAWDKSLEQAEKAMTLWADQTLLSLPSWRDIIPVLGALDFKVQMAEAKEFEIGGVIPYTAINSRLAGTPPAKNDPAAMFLSKFITQSEWEEKQGESESSEGMSPEEEQEEEEARAAYEAEFGPDEGYNDPDLEPEEFEMDEVSGHQIFPLADLTTAVKDLEVSVIPKMNGILPIRRSEAVTGAQAMYALMFFREVSEELGLKELKFSEQKGLGKRSDYLTYSEIKRAVDKKLVQDQVVVLSPEESSLKEGDAQNKNASLL